MSNVSSVRNNHLGAAFAPSRQTIGDFVGLCLLIDFPDERGPISRQAVDEFYNKPGYNGFGNSGSVYDYFFDMSGGKLRYTNLVAPYYTARHPKDYYTDEAIPNRAHAGELIAEALNHFKTQGFDFGRLTVDDGQYAYAVNIFYAGDCTNNWSNGLWPHQSSLATPFALGNEADGRFDLETTDWRGDTTDLFAAGEMDHFGGANDTRSQWWDGSSVGLQLNWNRGNR